MSGRYESVFVARLTTEQFDAAIKNRPVVILLPVGAVEPHGPHLPLDTDLIISRAAAERATHALWARDVLAFVAPDVAYGVTTFARDFSGAAGVSADALAAYLRSVVEGWLATGVAHVCVVNNHLEPAHDAAVRDAIAPLAHAHASVASPLTRRWARTLSDEFKRGACHAGEYETSIVQAADSDSVREAIRRTLPEVDVSLSDAIARGVDRFVDMGLSRGYAGAPARATPAHGEEMLARLAEMIVGEVTEAMG
ncbi:MAG TPA: creatininase family protein [Candidatus Krumholzibacteria bacterium]|nr:creatininase family protein [Candidatus Krumholzibacteria bacterium]